MKFEPLNIWALNIVDYQITIANAVKYSKQLNHKDRRPNNNPYKVHQFNIRAYWNQLIKNGSVERTFDWR